MESNALELIKSNAPEYSPLQHDWIGAPGGWRPRITRNNFENIVDL